MTAYVLYTRTEAGTIERKEYVMFHRFGTLAPDAHEECRMGWQERKVFWGKRTGASIGVGAYEASTVPINQPRAPKR